MRHSIGVDGSIKDEVALFGFSSYNAGADGIVCFALSGGYSRERALAKCTHRIPGVRCPEGAEKGDHEFPHLSAAIKAEQAPAVGRPIPGKRSS